MQTVKQLQPLSHRSVLICWSQKLSSPNWDACMNNVLTSADINRLKCITLGNAACQGSKWFEAFQNHITVISIIPFLIPVRYNLVSQFDDRTLFNYSCPTHSKCCVCNTVDINHNRL